MGIPISYIGLRKPTHLLVENFLFNVFKAQVEADKKHTKPPPEVHVVSGDISSNFISYLDEGAVFNIYAAALETIVQTSSYYSQDKVTYNIDVLVGPTTKIKLLEEMDNQAVLSTQMAMVYSDYARNILSDLRNRNFGMNGEVGNFNFIGIENFAPEYTQNERVIIGSKLSFSLDMVYYPFDTQEYVDLEKFIVNLAKDVRFEIDYK